MSDWIYLDYAAATPLDEAVLAAMQPYFAEQFYNPSAAYAPARQAAQALQAARGRLAHWLGARPGEVVFTAGGTEANNLAIHGVMDRYPEANLVVSAVEHESVLQPAGQYDCRLAAVDRAGRVSAQSVEAGIDGRTVLVSVMYANNEVGTIQPLRELAAVVQAQRRQRQLAGNRLPLYLHTDACQAAPYLDLHAARLGVDLMTINGGKIYGPKQSGALYVKAGVELRSRLQGGGQERGLRSGTESLAQCVGLAAALDRVQGERRQETARLQALQARFFALLAQELPQARVNGPRQRRLPNNVHITLPGQDNERLVLQLEAAGILAAAGSACSAASGQPSHVLRAMGLTDDDARASLRFTMGRATTEEYVVRTVQTLAAL